MDGLLFALSFEMVLLQMRILEGSSEIRLRNWCPTSRTEKLQHVKLIQDRDMVMDIIRKTLIEILENGEWHIINNAINVLIKKESHLKALMLTNQQLQKSRSSILLEVDIRRNQWATELRSADRQIAVLRDRMNDDVINANARAAYAEKWLYARFESLELKYHVPQPPKPRTNHEDRIHVELLRAYELQIKELEKALENWRQRYDIDIAVISLKVQEKCEQLRVARERREELQKLYRLHEGEMRGWLTFKRERAARLAREEHNRKSAVRIQAWWRGVMVRKAFGSFKYLRQTKKGKKK